MSDPLRVRRSSRALSSAVGLVVALAACDTGSVAPTAIAPTATANAVDATDALSANVKAGDYSYGNGCFTYAIEHGGSLLAPPSVVFDPPVCIPITLQVYESGSWSLLYPYGGPEYTTPDHPGWYFSIGDIWNGVSRNGKCRTIGNPYGGAGCVSETRYVRSMTFATSMVYARGNGTFYRTPTAVSWTYDPGKKP